MRLLTVYIDGACPMCVAGAIRFQKWDAARAIHFVNARDPARREEVRARFSDADALAEMRVQMPDGTWRTGYFAWAAILAALPRTRPLGLLMRLPVFYGLGPAVYRWVAARRLPISKLLRLPPPCDADGVCRLPAR